MVVAYSPPNLAKDLLLLGMDIAKGTWTDIQEEHSTISPRPPINLQNFVGALNIMIPRLIGPACVQVPPTCGGFVTNLRTVETDLIFARQIEFPNLVVFTLKR